VDGKNYYEDESERIVIRPAKPSDAPIVSRLMYYSNRKLALYLFAETERAVLRILHDLFQVPNHAFSYTQAFVAEYNGKVVGSVFGFCGGREKSLRLATIYKVGFRWFKIVRFRRIPRMIRALIILGEYTCRFGGRILLILLGGNAEVPRPRHQQTVNKVC